MGPSDPFEDDYPTNRQSGSLQRGPIWEGLASILAERMVDAERACERELEQLPHAHTGFGEAARSLAGPRLRARMIEARAIAEEATRLSRDFKAWEKHDPGYEAREATLAKWHALEHRARHFEIGSSPPPAH